MTNVKKEEGQLHLLAIGVEWYSRDNPGNSLQRSDWPAIVRLTHTLVTPKTLKKD